MKKGIVVVLMAVIVGIYIFSIRHKVEDSKKEVKDIGQELLQYKEEIEKAYPSTIEELMEINGQVLRIQYSKEMLPEYVEAVVDISRTFYAKPLLELNTREDQMNSLFKETLEGSVNEMYILSNELETITYIKEDAEAQAIVNYYTTVVDFQRTYDLIKEEGQWKIYRWEDALLTDGE